MSVPAAEGFAATGSNFGRDHCRRQSGATSVRFCSRLVGLLLLLFEDTFQGYQSSFGRRLGAPMQTLSISIGRFIAVGCGVRQAYSRFLVVPMQVGVGGIQSVRICIRIIIAILIPSTVLVSKFHGNSILLGGWTASWDAVPHHQEGWL
jgi:hypothetical protein